jgi:hypothetical protein
VIGAAHGSADRDAEEHLREVALFLRVHLDRAPGVLWPYFDHPVFDPEAGTAGMGLLARGLAALTGMPVSTVAASAERLACPADTGVWHMLVHQCSGRSQWSVFPGTAREAAPALSYTLRSGEVLYAPPGRACSVQHSADSRCVVSRLDAYGHEPAVRRAWPRTGGEVPSGRPRPPPGSGWSR